MKFFAVVVALAAVSCGGSAADKWTPKDTEGAGGLASMAISLEGMCDRDGGLCDPRAIRSVESGGYCAAASMLYRHNQQVPEAGIGCPKVTP